MTTYEQAKSEAYEMHRNGIEKVYAVFYETFLNADGHGRKCYQTFANEQLANNFYKMFADCNFPVEKPIEI